MGIGENIKRRRLATKMTQRGLARQAGIDQAGLSRIERGYKENLTVAVLRSLARALDCKVADLLDEENNQSPRKTAA